VGKVHGQDLKQYFLLNLFFDIFRKVLLYWP
jgi:hypothetical protein